MTPCLAVTPALMVLNLLAMFLFGLIDSLIAARLARCALEFSKSADVCRRLAQSGLPMGLVEVLAYQPRWSGSPLAQTALVSETDNLLG